MFDSVIIDICILHHLQIGTRGLAHVKLFALHSRSETVHFQKRHQESLWLVAVPKQASLCNRQGSGVGIRMPQLPCVGLAAVKSGFVLSTFGREGYRPLCGHCTI